MGEIMTEVEEVLYRPSYTVNDDMKYQCAICYELYSTLQLVRKHISTGHREFSENTLFTVVGEKSTFSGPDTYKPNVEVEAPSKSSLVDKSHLVLNQDSFNQIVSCLSTLSHSEEQISGTDLGAPNINSQEHIEVKCETELEVGADIMIEHSNYSPTRRKKKDIEQNIICEVCKDTFLNRNVLREHMKQHEGNFSCDLCWKVFPTLQQFNIHRRGHLLERKFKCESCDKSYKFKQQLEIHLLTHSGLKPFSCHICEKSFTLDRQLQNHLKIHSEEKPFVCNVCGKAFKLKQQLLNHDFTHLDIKPFTCEVCSKGFKLKQQLQNHLKVHEDFKPFVCRVCDKAFKFKQQLQNHLKVHEGNKEFLCEFCKKTFMFKQQLQIHLKIHYGIKEFPCEHCSKEFRTKQQLQKHLDMHQRKGEKVFKQKKGTKVVSEVTVAIAEPVTETETSIDTLDSFSDNTLTPLKQMEVDGHIQMDIHKESDIILSAYPLDNSLKTSHRNDQLNGGQCFLSI